ncbi:hypothetical protein Landi51_06589 [Colletotrichum acutatum]
MGEFQIPMGAFFFSSARLRGGGEETLILLLFISAPPQEQEERARRMEIERAPEQLNFLAIGRDHQSAAAYSTAQHSTGNCPPPRDSQGFWSVCRAAQWHVKGN